MTKREQILVNLRVAGYHGDSFTFVRLYVENRISRPVADAAYRAGAAQKAGGMRCSCYACGKAAGSAA